MSFRAIKKGIVLFSCLSGSIVFSSMARHFASRCWGGMKVGATLGAVGYGTIELERQRFLQRRETEGTLSNRVKILIENKDWKEFDNILFDYQLEVFKRSSKSSGLEKLVKGSALSGIEKLSLLKKVTGSIKDGACLAYLAMRGTKDRVVAEIFEMRLDSFIDRHNFESTEFFESKKMSLDQARRYLHFAYVGNDIEMVRYLFSVIDQKDNGDIKKQIVNKYFAELTHKIIAHHDSLTEKDADMIRILFNNGADIHYLDQSKKDAFISKIETSSFTDLKYKVGKL
ncbi:hypothetical protein HYV11_03940 [Candidatus Dependentiae bacterium]|nr:hypothetical protein [Candidatus Dependentiae bacterium]